MDYIRDELPTESTTITKKDQTYWNNKYIFDGMQKKLVLFQNCFFSIET